MIHRRITDRCMAKRLYERVTPYIQLGGFLALVGSILTGLWMGFCFIAAANANTSAIATLQQFQETTVVKLAVQEETDKNIKNQLNRIEAIQGKVFERINQIADRGR